MGDAPDNAGGLSGCAEVIAAALPQAIGEIEAVIGLVTVIRASGAVTQVKVGDPVYEHDTIETGADGAVGITFTDRTAFNLSNNARMVLSEFACGPNGTSNSALFSLRQGVFSFIGGKVAKTGNLRIDTPVGRIRAPGQSGGMGILTLAGLTFSVMNEVQAANRFDAFLDYDAISYKDFPHGLLEITTKDGRVIMHDDPGETLVVDPQGTVTHVPNTSSRMAELQGAQQAALSTLSQGMGQQGAAPGGSSTPTFDIPLQFRAINFSLDEKHEAAPFVTTIISAASSDRKSTRLNSSH